MRTLIVVFAMLVSLSATAATQAERRACEDRVNKEIEQINDRMRSGVSGRESERLNERLAQLRNEKHRCRNL